MSSRDSSRNSKRGPYTGKIPQIKVKDYENNHNLMQEIKKTQSSINNSIQKLNFKSGGQKIQILNSDPAYLEAIQRNIQHANERLAEKQSGSPGSTSGHRRQKSRSLESLKKQSPDLKFYKTDRDFNPLDQEEEMSKDKKKKSSVIEQPQKTGKPTTYSKISVRSVSSLDHQASQAEPQNLSGEKKSHIMVELGSIQGEVQSNFMGAHTQERLFLHASGRRKPEKGDFLRLQQRAPTVTTLSSYDSRGSNSRARVLQSRLEHTPQIMEQQKIIEEYKKHYEKLYDKYQKLKAKKTLIQEKYRDLQKSTQTTPVKEPQKDQTLKLQLYDKMNDLAKTRFEQLNKEIKNLEKPQRNSQLEVYSFNVQKPDNGQDLGVRQLWRWFKKLLQYYDIQMLNKTKNIQELKKAKQITSPPKTIKKFGTPEKEDKTIEKLFQPDVEKTQTVEDPSNQSDHTPGDSASQGGKSEFGNSSSLFKVISQMLGIKSVKMSYRQKKDAIIAKIEALLENQKEANQKDACVSPLLKDFPNNSDQLCQKYEEFLVYLCQMLDLNSMDELQKLVQEWLEKRTKESRSSPEHDVLPSTIIEAANSRLEQSEWEDNRPSLLQNPVKEVEQISMLSLDESIKRTSDISTLKEKLKQTQKDLKSSSFVETDNKQMSDPPMHRKMSQSQGTYNLDQGQ